MPLTLRRRSEEPPVLLPVPSPPLPAGGLRGGTWGPGRPRIFDEGGGGPGGISLNENTISRLVLIFQKVKKVQVLKNNSAWPQNLKNRSRRFDIKKKT